MGQDTYSDDAYGDESDRSQPEAYWRRRVITLCGGLALLALLAWAFSGGGGKPSNAAHPGSSSSSPGSSQASGILPAAAYSGSPSPGATGTNSAAATVGSAATLPFPVTSARGSQSASSRPGSGQSGSASPSGKAARAAKAGAKNNGGSTGVEPNGSCAPGSMVLSLFTSQTSYSAREYPAFQIDAVSTATRTCSFDISPKRLHVQVMSKGRVIWDSADCSRGEPNHSIEFRRGVPAETSVTWRRIVSLPGCVTVASSARPGSYQVQAKDDSVASPVRPFKLVR